MGKMKDLQILAQSLFPDFKALDSGELDFKDFFTKYQSETTSDLNYLRTIYEENELKIMYNYLDLAYHKK